jgi:protein CpxP
MEPKQDTQASTYLHRPKHRAFWLLLAIPLALAGAFAFNAYAMPGGFGFAGGASPAERKAFMERRLDRTLGVVDATDAQRTAIKAIFERTFAELRPIHQEHRRLHDDLVAAFGAAQVDRAAVEKLRGEATSLVDRGSQVLSKALLDAADVLTPQQRQTLIEHLREMHGRGQRRHGW